MIRTKSRIVVVPGSISLAWHVVGTCVLLLCLQVVSSAMAQTPDAKSVLERAIAYHGGRAALQALPDVKLTATLELGGRFAGRSVDAVFYDRGDGGQRSEVTFEFRGRKITAVTMYDGEMCKRRFRTTWDDMPLDENRERAAHRLPFLLDALERNPVLVGAGTEAGIDVWQVEVPDGRGKALLSFAQDDGHWVALEYPGTKAEGMGTKEEVTRKLVFHADHDVGGVKMPSDTEQLENGSFVSRIHVQSAEIIADWDDAWLQVPDPRKRYIPNEELAN